MAPEFGGTNCWMAFLRYPSKEGFWIAQLLLKQYCHQRFWIGIQNLVQKAMVSFANSDSLAKIGC